MCVTNDSVLDDKDFAVQKVSQSVAIATYVTSTHPRGMHIRPCTPFVFPVLN